MTYHAQLFFEPPTEELRYLPEGPRALQQEPGKLGWVAIQHAPGVARGSFNILDLASGRNASFLLEGRPGFFAETTAPGVVLIGLEHSLVYFNWMTGMLEGPAIAVTDDPRVIINEGLAVDGGVIFGTKHLDFALPIAALYFFDAKTCEVRTLLERQTCSNGKFLNGTTLIDVDSQPRTITEYKLNPERTAVLDARLICPPASLPAVPDGLRPAPDGKSIIVAFYNPAAVADGLAQQIQISDGTVLNEWIIPGSPRVTCPEFLMIDGKVKLLFTTALEGMPEAIRAIAPGAGCLYIADTPFTSLPSPPPLVQTPSRAASVSER